jgi:hypothetical protein
VIDADALADEIVALLLEHCGTDAEAWAAAEKMIAQTPTLGPQ